MDTHTKKVLVLRKKYINIMALSIGNLHIGAVAKKNRCTLKPGIHIIATIAAIENRSDHDRSIRYYR